MGWGYTEYDPFKTEPLEAERGVKIAEPKQQKLEVSLYFLRDNINIVIQIPILRNTDSKCSQKLGPTQVCAGGEDGKDSCKGEPKIF